MDGIKAAAEIKNGPAKMAETLSRRVKWAFSIDTRSV